MIFAKGATPHWYFIPLWEWVGGWVGGVGWLAIPQQSKSLIAWVVGSDGKMKGVQQTPIQDWCLNTLSEFVDVVLPMSQPQGLPVLMMRSASRMTMMPCLGLAYL